MDSIQRDEVASLGHHRSYGRDEIVVFGGESWPYLLVVVEGAIDVVKESPEGRRLIL